MKYFILSFLKVLLEYVRGRIDRLSSRASTLGAYLRASPGVEEAKTELRLMQKYNKQPPWQAGDLFPSLCQLQPIVPVWVDWQEARREQRLLQGCNQQPSVSHEKS